MKYSGSKRTAEEGTLRSCEHGDSSRLYLAAPRLKSQSMQPNIVRIIQFACIALLLTVPLFGQSTAPIQTDPLARFDIPTNISSPDFPNVLTNFAVNGRQQFIDYMVDTMNTRAAFNATFRNLLQSVENGRVDEQAGASATSGGTASAAEKAGISGLLTAALESGAMTQTLDQNLFTVRGNAEGLFRFLSGQDVLPVCFNTTDTSCDPSPLNNLEFTASFDVSKSNTQTVSGQNPSGGATLAALLTSDKRQFSSASARFAIINSRDLRSKRYRDAWNTWFSQNHTALMQAGSDLLAAEDQIFLKMQSEDANGRAVTLGDSQSVYQVWLRNANSVLLGVIPRTAAGVRLALTQQLDLLIAQMRSLHPDLDDKVLAARSAYSRYYANTSGGFELGNQPMLTLQGSYQKPSLQPDLVNAKLVFAWSPKKKGTANPGTLTLNGGVSIYTRAQPKDANGNTSRWHDAQFAVQFDRPIDSKALSTLTIGGYFQYQISPGLVNIPAGAMSPPGTTITLPPNGAQLLSKSGTIAVVQASMTLQIPNSGIRVPIGISWSNRTELLTGNEIRGHIGFSFDSHSILLLGKEK